MTLYSEIYDVLIIGAGTGGRPAAVGAARAGAKVLLVEVGVRDISKVASLTL